MTLLTLAAVVLLLVVMAFMLSEHIDNDMRDHLR